jgi:hypothetical protein
MYDYIHFFLFSFHGILQMISQKLEQGGGGYVFVADDPDSHMEVVLKMIPLGPEGSEKRSSYERMIKKEMEIELYLRKEATILFRRLERSTG